MTLAEIMAGLGASQAIGQASTGALLTRTAEGERRDILDAQRQLEEQQRARERKAKTRGRRRGIGRLIGSAAGALLALPTGGLSLAAGAALGSALGQAGAAATEKGGYKLGRVGSGLGGGMFFKGGRADISSAEADINRYIDEANTGYLQNIAASTVTDYLTASSLGKLEGFGKYADIAAGEGGRGAALREMFKDTIFKKAPEQGSTIFGIDLPTDDLRLPLPNRPSTVGSQGFLGGKRVDTLAGLGRDSISRSFGLDAFGRGRGMSRIPGLYRT